MNKIEKEHDKFKNIIMKTKNKSFIIYDIYVYKIKTSCQLLKIHDEESIINTYSIIKLTCSNN